MAYPEGLLCAPLELHRRSFALLTGVLRPPFAGSQTHFAVGSNPPELIIKKATP